MTAAERITFYCERFPVVELDASYRFPPTPRVCQQWVQRTPPGFIIDVQAWTLLTGNATLPDSLWVDLRGEVRPEVRDRRRLYIDHLSRDGRREAWARFAHALRPLGHAGRLGAVILRYPHWLRPGRTGQALLGEARRMLPDLPLAVELRNPHWLSGDQCERTLSLLEAHDLAFVCVDSADAVPVVATTADLAVVRLAGRNPGSWDDPDLPLPRRFAYRYSAEELRQWCCRIGQLAEAADTVHVLFANPDRDFAVRDAADLALMVS